MNESATLGIDFGTCRTSAAVVFGTTPQSVPFGKTRAFDFPTAVFVDGSGGFLVGEEAFAGALKNTGHLFTEFKLSVGRRERMEVDGFGFEYRDLVKAVLERVRRTAEVQLNNGQPIRAARITVPALYEEGGDAWRAMEEAGRDAGFESVELLREPHAAAIYYDWLQQQGSDAVPMDGVTLVYDLGGGTFDPALIERSGDDYRILDAHSSGSEGVQCGGMVFDELIRSDFESKCPGIVQELRLDPARNEDTPVRRRRLRDAGQLQAFLTDAKICLSEPGGDTYSGEEPVRGEPYRLTRSEFEAMIAPLLDETLESCERVVVRSGREWKEVKRILMVGGSCNIPLVRKKLEAYAKKRGASPEICWRRIGTTDKFYDPLLAVSLGAALKGVKADPLVQRQEWYAKAETLRQGLGVPTDLVAAAKWYLKAADAGQPDAQFWTGFFLAEGLGGGKNLSEACRWFRKGADQGNAPAQYQLGLCTQQGRGVAKNLDEARFWYRKAADQGNQEAKKALAQLEREMEPPPAPPPPPPRPSVPQYSASSTSAAASSSSDYWGWIGGGIAVGVVLLILGISAFSSGGQKKEEAVPVVDTTSVMPVAVDSAVNIVDTAKKVDTEVPISAPNNQESSAQPTAPVAVKPQMNRYGAFTDPRDDKTYKTVRIGSQTWMAENLNYATSSGSWCYNDDASNCSTYGRLYDWETAQSVALTGWHLPTYEEWKMLLQAVGEDNGKKLVSIPFDGTDKFGFSVLPAGCRHNDGSFDYLGGLAYFWSSSPLVSPYATGWDFCRGCDAHVISRVRSYGLSVRLLKD